MGGLGLREVKELAHCHPCWLVMEPGLKSMGVIPGSQLQDEAKCGAVGQLPGGQFSKAVHLTTGQGIRWSQLTLFSG